MISKVLVLLPTFNDSSLLGELVSGVQALGENFQPLVIDDGSHQPINSSVLPAGCLFVRLPDNYGLGVATQIAFKHVIKHDYEMMVRIDSDGQHPVDRIKSLLAPIEGGDADVTAGCRENQYSGSGPRLIFGWLVKTYLSSVVWLVTWGKAPSDVNTGFLAFNRKAVITLNKFLLERYPEPQILVLACRSGLTVGEIIIQQNDRYDGASSVTMGAAIRIIYRFTIFAISEVLQKSPKK